MSRIARKPLKIPAGVAVVAHGDTVSIKGKKGEFALKIKPELELSLTQETVSLKLKAGYTSKANKAILGTTIVLLGNMLQGVCKEFVRKLQLIGVGYRAKAQGNKIELSLGFSHPVSYIVPNGITVETPSNTEIILQGIDKEIMGQTAADIRAFRPPEIYKGKGIRYAEEVIVLKETKKKK